MLFNKRKSSRRTRPTVISNESVMVSSAAHAASEATKSSTSAQQRSLVSQHTSFSRAQEGILDFGFYRLWYEDLRSFKDDALLKHWTQYGQKERRFPSFRALLAGRNLDISNLPRLFDWKFYRH